MEMRGVYREIFAPERLVHTEVYGEPWSSGETLVHVDLIERRGQTTATMRMLYESQQARDEAIASGMEHGMAASFDRFAELLESLPDDPTAERFTQFLYTHQSAEEAEKIQRYFKSGPGEYGEGDVFIGVRMGQVFALAREFIAMPIAEIERLLESPVHEIRAGAVSIMKQKARRKRASAEERRELYELYMRRHDRINNWDLVDLGAPSVVGEYLLDKPRDVLYELAVSENLWERRTAAVSTLAFATHGDVDDIFRVARILLHDDHDLIHKAVGWTLREAGKAAPQRLLTFLDEHGETMPRTLLRYAIERLDDAQKAHYKGLKSVKAK